MARRKPKVVSYGFIPTATRMNEDGTTSPFPPYQGYVTVGSRERPKERLAGGQTWNPDEAQRNAERLARRLGAKVPMDLGHGMRLSNRRVTLHRAAHSDPSHHIGPCDEACRRGRRLHAHRGRE